jgi:hypothetical protein
MAKSANDAIVTISIGAKSEKGIKMAKKILDVIRDLEEYATDDAEFGPDRRNPGGQNIYQQPFTFHVQ